MSRPEKHKITEQQVLARQLTLSLYLKLKREKNYAQQKEALENIATTYGLKRYYYDRTPSLLEYIDEFDNNIDQDKLDIYSVQVASDTKMKIAI